MTPAIAFRAVSHSFGAHSVLSEVTLEIGRGEIYGLAGANGSGKTTLLRAAAGAIRPAGGSIQVMGTTGYVAQKFGMYEDLLVEENLRFFARCHGLSGAELETAVDRVVGRFGLAGRLRTPAGFLSHGWKQRLAIASALCHRPTALILDEATSGIDLATRFEIWELLVEFARDGVGIVLATHDTEELSRCDRIGYLQGGRLIVSGTAGEVRALCGEGLGREPESLTAALAWFARGAGQ